MKDTWQDDGKNANFYLGVHPNDGAVRIIPMVPPTKNALKYENRLMFIRFDHITNKQLQLQKRIYFAGTGTNLEFRIAKLPKKSKTDVNYPLDTLYSINVTCFYATINKPTKGVGLLPLVKYPVIVDENKEVERPQDLLVALNKKSTQYGFTFSYNSTIDRFQLTSDGKYAIELSKSLSAILGFSTQQRMHSQRNSYVAEDFPLLNRGITALYVYTNIINAVYIGDVKAPLLLTCPLKRKGKQDIVHQVEFLKPTYIPLNRNSLEQINIGIYDDAGVLIPFLYGKTKLTLHFRRRSML